MPERQSRLGEVQYLEADLSPSEQEVVRNVEAGHWGVREYARHTERSPGTVGNLLRRAREKLGEVEG